MRVAMFGYQTWGQRTLQALLKSRHEVCLVVTHPASDHAYESIWADSVEDLATKRGHRGVSGQASVARARGAGGRRWRRT